MTMTEAQSNSIVFRVLDWIYLLRRGFFIVGLISISYYVMVTAGHLPGSLPWFFYAGIPLSYLCELAHYSIHEFCLIPIKDGARTKNV